MVTDKDPVAPRSPERFDAHYAGIPPWDIGRPQPAFLALAQSGAIRGRVLDVGCGTGDLVLMAAAMGLDATGVDMAAAAIKIAESKARERGLSARFLIWDVLQLTSLNEQFDTVLDSGLFHVLEEDDLPRFADNLRAVMKPGGRYFMMCFSDRQPGLRYINKGPRRVTQDEIRASFKDGWTVDSIQPGKIDMVTNPDGALMWLATITRV